MSNKTKRVLLIVEGADTEVRLFEKFYTLYGKDNVDIISFGGGEIFVFYDKLKMYLETDSLYDLHIDFPLFFKDYTKREFSLNNEDFTDRILVFDFEPHSDKFDSDILIEMMEVFSDSTQKGKLFLNYPMVESFKDMENLDDKDFHKSIRTLEESRDYKKHVGYKSRNNKISDIRKIGVEEGNKLLSIHKEKLDAIISSDIVDQESQYLDLLQKQCDKIKFEQSIWVLNTGILHLLEEYGPLQTSDI